LTSICLSPDGKSIFAGCWDKLIWSWDAKSKQVKRKFKGHSDFVKSLTSTRLKGQDVLISGGADTKIIVFNVQSGERLFVLNGHTRAIQDLVIDPLLSEQNDANSIRLFSAGSEREIRIFQIPPLNQDQGDLEQLIHHETSVYKLFFDADADLWTASADKTAKCLVRDRNWQPELVLEHPDFVRDVVVYERGGLVVTACRDEEIRVWNRAVRSTPDKNPVNSALLT
jgi:WD40 repeat protein